MDAKEFVKNKMPEARAERHRMGSNQTYYLIRNGRSFMYFSEGKTLREAWKNAKIKLLEKTNG